MAFFLSGNCTPKLFEEQKEEPETRKKVKTSLGVRPDTEEGNQRKEEVKKEVQENQEKVQIK